jgi:hypothetical protein
MHGDLVAAWVGACSTFFALVIVPVFLSLTKKGRRGIKKLKAVWRWLVGTPGIEGIVAEIPSAPALFVEVRKEVKTLSVDVGKVLSVLDEIRLVAHDNHRLATETKDEVTPNGGTSNKLGDVVRRRAEKDGDWIEEEIPL